MDQFAQARRNMVDCQLRTFDVSDRAVLAAMNEIPREAFVPPEQRQLAYLDRAVPLSDEDGDESRYLLPPMVLGRLIQELAVESGMRILDVADASGYAAAVLARMGADVTVLMSSAEAAENAAASFTRTGETTTVSFRSGHPSKGLPDEPPYGAVLINGAVEETPGTLIGQLREGGRLACVAAESRTGRARLYVRSGDGYSFRTLFDAVVPTLPAFRRAPGFVF